MPAQQGLANSRTAAEVRNAYSALWGNEVLQHMNRQSLMDEYTKRVAEALSNKIDAEVFADVIGVDKYALESRRKENELRQIQEREAELSGP